MVLRDFVKASQSLPSSLVLLGSATSVTIPRNPTHPPGFNYIHFHLLFLHGLVSLYEALPKPLPPVDSGRDLVQLPQQGPRRALTSPGPSLPSISAEPSSDCCLPAPRTETHSHLRKTDVHCWTAGEIVTQNTAPCAKTLPMELQRIIDDSNPLRFRRC